MSENANKEDVRLCNWDKGKVCAKEDKGVSVVKRGERRDV